MFITQTHHIALKHQLHVIDISNIRYLVACIKKQSNLLLDHFRLRPMAPTAMDIESASVYRSIDDLHYGVCNIAICLLKQLLQLPK